MTGEGSPTPAMITDFFLLPLLGCSHSPICLLLEQRGIPEEETVSLKGDGSGSLRTENRGGTLGRRSHGDICPSYGHFCLRRNSAGVTLRVRTVLHLTFPFGWGQFVSVKNTGLTCLGVPKLPVAEAHMSRCSKNTYCNKPPKARHLEEKTALCTKVGLKC